MTSLGRLEAELRSQRKSLKVAAELLKEVRARIAEIEDQIEDFRLGETEE